MKIVLKANDPLSLYSDILAMKGLENIPLAAYPSSLIALVVLLHCHYSVTVCMRMCVRACVLCVCACVSACVCVCTYAHAHPALTPCHLQCVHVVWV